MYRSAAARPFAALLLASVVLASSCGSTAETTVNLTAPTAVRCQPALGAQSSSFESSGGTGTVAVTVARECSWTASVNAQWIVLTSGQEGQGDGTVAYRISENVDPTLRRGTITVAEQTVQVAQEPAPCRFTVAAGEVRAPAAGADLSVDVRTHSACTWTASASASWAAPAPSSGSGNAAVHVRVPANDGPLRTADLTIAGQRVAVIQEGRAATPAPPPPAPTPVPPPPAPPLPGPPAPPPVQCVYQLTSIGAGFEATGGVGVVPVRTTAGCPWSAQSSATWVTISSAPSGVGDGEVRYVVAENFSTSPRTTAITIGSQIHRIAQDRAEEIELEGKISALSGSCPNLRFAVANRIVTTDRDTEFKSGKCSDARNGKDVKVKGFRQSDGTVDARRVEFEDDDD